MLIKRKNVAVYHEGLYLVEYNDLTVDYFFRGLKDFEITWISYEALKIEFTSIAKGCAEIINYPIEPIPLQIGTSLKKFLNFREDWVKTTQTLSKNTLLFRDELKKAYGSS